MGSISKIVTAAMFCALVLITELGRSEGKTENKGKATLDLDDYIDTGKDKNEDLSSSATGYYGHHDHGYSHHPVYHHHHESYGHHHAHPVDYGHAHTYFAGEYGGYGHAHVGSAHVSYGTEISHGHSHHHLHGYHG